MKHSMQHSALALLLAAAAAWSCNDDKGDDGNAAGSGSFPQTVLSNLPDVPGALGPNSPATPGQRIDRAGRPAITAALIGTFLPDTAERDVKRDRYNTSSIGDPSFLPDIVASLGILDSLDDKCGTQLLFGAAGDATPYLALAQALNDDELYVNSAASSSGSVYLGVEGEATKALSPGQGSAGGRIPGDDVIERSYSVLALGALRGFDDGVPSDDVRHDPDTFPFIAPPQ